MNTKVVYAAGIALLMIGIIFYFIDSGFFTYEKPPPPPAPVCLECFLRSSRPKGFAVLLLQRERRRWPSSCHK